MQEETRRLYGAGQGQHYCWWEPQPLVVGPLFQTSQHGMGPPHKMTTLVLLPVLSQDLDFEAKTQQHHPPYSICLLPRLLLLSQVSIQDKIAFHFIVIIPRYSPIFHPSQSSIALTHGTTKSAVLSSLYVRITWKDFKDILTYDPHLSPNDSEFLEVGPRHLCLLISVRLTR